MEQKGYAEEYLIRSFKAEAFCWPNTDTPAI